MPRLQKTLVLVLLAILTLPLPLTGVFRFFAPKGGWANWWMNRSLGGITIPTHSAPLTPSTWMSTEFQQSTTAWVNENFAGRELAIRTCNHVLWTLFGRPTSKKGIIVRGPDDHLFEEPYLYHFSLQSGVHTPRRLETMAAQLKEIQDRLASDGVAFAVVFTPSKPVCQPGSVPARYRTGVRPDAVRSYDLFLPILRNTGVHVVDGAGITRDLAARMPGPTFPKNGTHWFDVVAFHTAEALLREVERQKNVPLARLQQGPITVSAIPNSTDTDLAGLLNIWRIPPGQYLHAERTLAADSPPPSGQVAIVGGSFVHYLNAIWDETGAWERIHFYYYYKLGVIQYPGGNLWRPQPHAVDWPRDFLSVDAVVLEMNENVVAGNHVTTFIEQGLIALRDLEPKAPVELGYPGNGWHREETDKSRHWRWTRGTVELELTNRAAERTSVTLDVDLTSFEIVRQVTIRSEEGNELWTGTCTPQQWTNVRNLRIDVPPGSMRIRFETDLPGHRGSGRDARELAFGVFNLRVRSAPASPPLE